MNIKDIGEWLTSVAKSPKTSRKEASLLNGIELHYSGYAESGYSDPESGIIALGNWNQPSDYVKGEDGCFGRFVNHGRGTVSRVAKVLEHLGVEMEWSDKWMSCGDCGKLVRSQPDCYSWTPSYVILHDCELLCCECAAKDPEAIISEFEGRAKKALTPDLGIDPTNHGWVMAIEDLENGFHAGMDADPKVIKKELKALGVERFLFMITGQSQFYVTFALFIHEDEKDRLEEIARIKTDGPSVSEGLKRALQDASVKMGELSGGGIKVANCDCSTGKASVKLISPEDFIAGKA